MIPPSLLQFVHESSINILMGVTCNQKVLVPDIRGVLEIDGVR